MSPPTYLSEGLASAPPTPAFYKTSPARGPRTRDMDDAQAAAPEVGGARSDARGCARRCARHGARHFTRGDPPLDVTVSAFRNRLSRSFVAPCRAETRNPSRTTTLYSYSHPDDSCLIAAASLLSHLWGHNVFIECRFMIQDLITTQGFVSPTTHPYTPRTRDAV